MPNFRGWFASGLVLLVAIVAAWGDDPATAEKEQLKRRGQQLRESLDWYRLIAGRDAQAPMKPEIVQRWANPTRSQKGETALVFWTDAGRPEALASVYPWNGNLIYECVSLARDPGLRASEGERSIWSPAAPGVTFHDFPEAPAPAPTPVARLAQMKALAGLFKVTMTSMKNGVVDHEEMRLLPRPIHRIDPASTKMAHPDLVDGATFAFVQGTDPEAVLMIEAVRRGQGAAWQYAFGRSTTLIVEAKLGPAVVWKADNQPSWNDPKLPVIAVGRRLVD